VCRRRQLLQHLRCFADVGRGRRRGLVLGGLGPVRAGTLGTGGDLGQFWSEAPTSGRRSRCSASLTPST
jgi:hypothetical protein